MRSLADHVYRTVRRYELIPAGERVLVALSGGPDSVALLHLLCELQERGVLVVAGAAHFNHQLRTAAADDEAFCRELAARLGIVVEVGGANVRALARRQHTSIEDAARAARYEFLEKAATLLRAERIAVGHTRDDQAETFLLRLLRGAGPGGLAGIYPRAGRVVRPLLEVARADILKYLGAGGLSFREDESNRDLTIPRNRVRHELLPYLRQHFSPGVDAVLAREAVIARDDHAWLEREAIEQGRTVVLRSAGSTELDATRLRALDLAIARRVVRWALEQVAPERFVGFEHVGAVLDLARGTGGGAERTLHLPGTVATCRRTRIVVERARAEKRRRDDASVNQIRVLLSIPGEAAVPGLGWTISAERVESLSSGEKGWLAGRGTEVAVDAAELVGPLTIRTRRPGDAFRPLGMDGRKKLQDFFVDRKVGRDERDRVPLVVDARDRIVWVVGHAVAEDFRVTVAERPVIFLKVRRLGGTG